MTNNHSANINNILRVCIMQVECLQTKAFNRELTKLGITKEKFGVLHQISLYEDNPTPFALARRMIYEPGTISGILTRMEADGLVIKHKDLKSKHMVRIEMTEKGRTIFEEAFKILKKLDDKLMASLNLEQKEQLVASLLTLRDNSMHFVYGESKEFPSTSTFYRRAKKIVDYQKLREH
ncbi:hypothetical protein X792_00485 [Dehalococcoides mccartyi CG1]|jgi:DNA-binding MarR family transcriptional regulator|uniref:MarR family winged helix-turn-helix transcriptional regulator n=1 Tax=Dehalococcoides mccartyi TaxID=61435 RepID=UPI0004E031A5|nr:MarR family transcriptional regulator [Dehalococcoides mccartyi]AII58649.1 hypothetical protein X792_00485 [Dehalococcoides mccartyi CG1]